MKRPPDLMAPGTDYFEQGRRPRETRNEVVFHSILAACLAVPLVLNLVSFFRPAHEGFHPTVGLMLLVSIGFLVSIGMVIYHRRNPPYSRYRKYFTSLLIVVCNFFALVFLRFEVPAPALSFMSIGLQVLAVILSGLRFSTRAVVVTGAVALASHLLLHLFLAACPSPLGSYFVPSLVLAVVLIGAATFCVTYIVSSMIRLHRESVRKERLSRFLAPEVVEEISTKPELLHQATENRVATILFADIRGFTTLSEQHPAEEIGRILNAILEEMTSAIMDNQGMVDKYIGDAIMGVFGVPVAAENHALQATRAALDMQERLKKVNQALTGEGKPAVSIGVGIHTGEVIAGAIGSSRRLDYTVIGDTVNVASRIESMTRQYPESILVSAETRDLIQESIPMKEVATTQLKGRKQPVTLFSPHNQVPTSEALKGSDTSI
jgi:class 3 adenylate cyclase